MSVTFLGFHKGQQYSSRLRTRDLYKVSIVVGSLVLNTLNTHDATDRALQVIALMWGVQERSDDTVTPRSRSILVGCIESPLETEYDITSDMTKGSS